jgi:hypothetical protein
MVQALTDRPRRTRFGVVAAAESDLLTCRVVGMKRIKMPAFVEHWLGVALQKGHGGSTAWLRDDISRNIGQQTSPTPHKNEAQKNEDDAT